MEKLLGFEVTSVACGASHVVAVTNEHEVFTWGRGDNGRLGTGSAENACTPVMVGIPEGCKPVQAFCGSDCSVVVADDGSMLSCGSNRFEHTRVHAHAENLKHCVVRCRCNKLALDSVRGRVDEADVFTRINSTPLNKLAVRQVSLGMSHSAVITDDGDVYTFGANQFGQLGHGSDAPNNMPHKVMALHDKPVLFVACGDTFTVAATKGLRLNRLSFYMYISLTCCCVRFRSVHVGQERSRSARAIGAREQRSQESGDRRRRTVPRDVSVVQSWQHAHRHQK